jgi:hypothetical protein
MNNLPQRDEEFEREDLRGKPILWFLGGLTVVLVLVYFSMRGMFGLLNAYDHNKAEKSQQNPLVTTTADPDQRRNTSYPQTHAEISHHFSEPRLEEDERTELKDVRIKEEEMLHGYGWVDEQAGTVRIPIDRAMQLTVERGLPTRPQGTPAVTAGAGGKKASRAK